MFSLAVGPDEDDLAFLYIELLLPPMLADDKRTRAFAVVGPLDQVRKWH